MSTAVESPRVRWQHDERLKNIVDPDDRCTKLVAEALSLAESFYGGLAMRTYRLAPAHKGHDHAHLERVERNLGNILFGLSSATNEHFFHPSPFEMSLLLSAVWLHGIGMLHGVFYHSGDERDANPDDRPIEQIDWEHYELRTNDYINRFWRNWCSWTHFEKNLLCQVCQSHRLHVDLGSLDKQAGANGGGIRLRATAALFRLADICDARQQHIPSDLSAAIYPMLSLEERRDHCGISRLIGGVSFQHSSGQVRPFWSIPHKKQFGPLVVDFEPPIRCFTAALDRILKDISPHVSEYLNIHFHSVSPVISRVGEDISPPDEHFVDTWPDLLTAVTSASEAASMVALVLCTIAEKTRRVSKDEVKRILKQALGLHPFNFLVHLFVADIESTLENLQREPDDARRCEPFIAHLREYLKKRAQACQLVAERTATLVKPRGTVVIYGFSRNVTEFLLRFSDAQQRVVIAVPCNRQDPYLFSEHENFKLQEILRNAGLYVEERSILELPQVVEARSNVIALLGARGVFQDGCVVATIGNAGVAAVARSFGARILVLAEPDKYRVGERIEEAIRDRLNRQSKLLVSRCHAAGRVIVDLLQPDKYDWIVGPEDKPIPGACTDETG